MEENGDYICYIYGTSVDPPGSISLIPKVLHEAKSPRLQSSEGPRVLGCSYILTIPIMSYSSFLKKALPKSRGRVHGNERLRLLLDTN